MRLRGKYTATDHFLMLCLSRSHSITTTVQYTHKKNTVQWMCAYNAKQQLKERNNNSYIWYDLAVSLIVDFAWNSCKFDIRSVSEFTTPYTIFSFYSCSIVLKFYSRPSTTVSRLYFRIVIRVVCCTFLFDAFPQNKIINFAGLFVVFDCDFKSVLWLNQSMAFIDLIDPFQVNYNYVQWIFNEQFRFFIFCLHKWSISWMR